MAETMTAPPEGDEKKDDGAAIVAEAEKVTMSDEAKRAEEEAAMAAESGVKVTDKRADRGESVTPLAEKTAEFDADKAKISQFETAKTEADINQITDAFAEKGYLKKEGNEYSVAASPLDKGATEVAQSILEKRAKALVRITETPKENPELDESHPAVYPEGSAVNLATGGLETNPAQPDIAAINKNLKPKKGWRRLFSWMR